MGFFNFNFFKKGASLKAPNKITNESFFDFIKHGSAVRVNPGEAYRLYEQIGPLSDAVDMIAGKFADIRPIVVNDQNVPVDRPEVDKFFVRPNNVESWQEFAFNLAVNYLLNQNAYVQAVGYFKSKPISIYNVANSKVTVTSGNSQSIYDINITGFYAFLMGNFIMTSEEGRILSNDPRRELYHIRGFNQNTESLVAPSILSSIKGDMDVVDQSLFKTVSLLRNGFSASGVFNLKTQDRESFEQFKSDLNNYFSGAGNAGKAIASMSDSVTYTKADQTSKDMESLESKKDSRNQIYARYDIPQPLVDQSSQTYNNYQTALYALYDNAVLPLADKVFSKLTKMFKDRNMLGDKERITYDEQLIPALQLRKNEELKVLTGSEVLSINELRATVGYESIDNGDDVFIQSSKIPIGEDVNTDDSLDDRKKDFATSLKKGSFTDKEIDEYWNDYQSII